MWLGSRIRRSTRLWQLRCSYQAHEKHRCTSMCISNVQDRRHVRIVLGCKVLRRRNFTYTMGFIDWAHVDHRRSWRYLWNPDGRASSCCWVRVEKLENREKKASVRPLLPHRTLLDYKFHSIRTLFYSSFLAHGLASWL